MKFGETLLASRLRGWEAHYFNYNRLKDKILEAEEDDSIFAKAMLAEEERVGLFVAGKLAELVDKIEFLRDSCEEGSESLAKSVSEDIARLGEFIQCNNEGVRKILKKYRKVLKRSTTWHNPDTKLTRAFDVIHQLIIALSNYHAARLTSSTPWNPPSSFERTTIKYWVQPEHIIPLKLHVIENLPILEIYKTPFPNRSLDISPPTQTHNFVSSIYLDNDQLQCYHERINQYEGAELLRVRWYGGIASSSSALPGPDASFVFFERKIHHESWVGEKSVKARFPIHQSLLSPFMDGMLDASACIDFMVASGAVKPKEVADLKRLATEVQASVLSKKLKPMVRTAYHRTAFQLSNSNDVRVSLDFPLYILAENDAPDYWKVLKGIDEPDEPFPYGVLEIKVSGESPPPWVESLLAKGWARQASKFSKYQHGAATYYDNACVKIPYWIEEFSNDHDLPEKDKELLDSINNSSKLPRLSIAPTTRKSISVAKHSDNTNSALLITATVPAKEDAKLAYPPLTKAQTTKSVPKKPVTDKRTNLARVKIEPKTFFANERTYIQWVSAAVMILSISLALMSISGTSKIVGVVMFPLALMFVIYAIWIYQWRLNKIHARDGSAYYDRYGPWFFALGITMAAAASLALIWTSYTNSVEFDFFQSSTSFCTAADSRCSMPTSDPIATTSYTVISAQAKYLRANYTIPILSCSNAINTSLRSVDSQEVLWEVTEESFCFTDLTVSLTCDPDASLPRVIYVHETQMVYITWKNANPSFAAAINTPQLNTSAHVRTYIEAECGALTYSVSVAINKVSAAPGTVQELNTLIGYSLFAFNTTLSRVGTSYGAVYNYTTVIAGYTAVITLNPVYYNPLDRANFEVPAFVKIAISLPRSFSLTAWMQSLLILRSLTSIGNFSPSYVEQGLVLGIVLGIIAIVMMITLLITIYRARKVQNIRPQMKALGGAAAASVKTVPEQTPKTQASKVLDKVPPVAIFPADQPLMMPLKGEPDKPSSTSTSIDMDLLSNSTYVAPAVSSPDNIGTAGFLNVSPTWKVAGVSVSSSTTDALDDSTLTSTWVKSTEQPTPRRATRISSL